MLYSPIEYHEESTEGTDQPLENAQAQ